MLNSRVLTLAALCALSGITSAQDSDVVLRGTYEHYATRLEVQVDSESIRFDDTTGSLVDTSGRPLGGLPRIFASADVEALFPISRRTADRWHAEARAQVGDGEMPGHLGRWFRVTAKDAESAQRLIEVLRSEARVTTAYFEARPSLPRIQGSKPKNNDLPPTTPSFLGQQGYLGAPPLGIHTAPARVILGGRGQGVQVTDMETGWYLDHEDICQLTTAAFLGRIDAAGNHGTAVVGEYASDRNRYGTTGISDLCTVKVSSWDDGGVSGAITRGVNASQPGDIVLLEVHYRTSLGFVPAEYFSSNYNIIKSATTRGVHIVEAGGNGGNDLDNQSRFGRLFDLSFRDSGAIMVGATNGSATARAGFSNHGARITANGWGYNVVTAGYGNLFNPNNDRRQHYTRSFSGTSSASPIVTGAVASLVGAVKFQDEQVLSVDRVRQLLRAHGTPCTGKIQRRPDLKAMLAAVGLPDGLTARSETVSRGTNLNLDMTAPRGHFGVAWIADKVVKTDLGLNRKFHLDLTRLIGLPVATLRSGAFTYSVRVPNDAALLDACFYAQGITFDSALRTVHVTSSTEFWVQ